MSDNERDTRPSPQQREGDLYKWSGETNGKNCPQPGNSQADLYGYDGSGKHQRPAGTDETPADDHVPANWHPDYSLSSPSAKEWFKESQALRKQKLDLDQNGDHVVQHGDSLWTIAQRELHDTGKQGSNQEIQQEVQQIVKLNENLHPSLRTKPDFIGDGWKLHIEPRGQSDQTQPTDDQGQQGDNHHRCIPKPDDHSEVTPPGYSTKHKVIVNYVDTDTAIFNQGGGRQGGNADCPDRVLPNRGDDVYRYSGDPGRNGNGAGNDVYAYGGDGGSNGRNQGYSGRNNGDFYNYSGDSNGRQQQPDVYSYGGDGSGRQGDNYNYSGDPNGGQRDNYNYSGDQRSVPYTGTGNDGTSFYPGAGSAQDQLHPDIVNYVHARLAIFNQGGGSFEPPPHCRIMHRAPYQSGQDNYYSNRPTGRNDGPIIPMNDNGNGSYQQIPVDQTQYPSGDGSANYYTYNPNASQASDYYSRARSQQGYNVNDQPSTYNNPSGSNGSDEDYAY